MNNKMVSIIMPVYNAELYLDRAIQSILSQDYKDIQLLIIDDGSTDDSLNICNEWGKKDYRIEVLSQENSGPSKARNLGLCRVTGQYLLFVDSDDMLLPAALSKLVKKMKETGADVCFFGWNEITEEGITTAYRFSHEEITSSKEQRYMKILSTARWSGGGYPWNKIWRVDAIRKNGELRKFDQTLTNFEDKLWVLENLDQISSVCYENSVLYNYYIKKTSLSHGSDYKLYKGLLAGAEKIMKYVTKSHPSASSCAKAFYQSRIVLYFWAKKILFKTISDEDVYIANEFDIKQVKITSCKDVLRTFYVWFSLLIKGVNGVESK